MRNPTILIAKSDDILRQNLKRWLLPHGFEVIEAPDRARPHQYFQSKKPDIVIIGSTHRKTDDGLKTVSQIRRQYKGD